MKGKYFQGIVSNKYLDPNNHMKPTLSLKEFNADFILTNEQSGFYDFVEIGDSLEKEPNSLTVRLWRNDTTLVKKLDFNCLDKQ